MNNLTEIVLASNNSGKIREFSALFARYNIKLITQGELGITEADEPHPTFIENALAKARHASRFSGKPALADDSGICAHALNGLPGVISARYAGEAKSDIANNALLCQKLASEDNKSISYFCALVLVRHELDPTPIIAEGIWTGEFIDTPRGENGFGYDPHFYLAQYQQTAAEISPELKNRLSHRAQAMTQLIRRLDILTQISH